jgi:ribosome biogenesis GTPase A
LNRLRIVVTGNNKAGKSCLINTILESEILYSNEDSATEFVLIIKPTKNKPPELWNCDLYTKTLSNAAYITYFNKIGDVIATGYENVKAYIKEANLKLKKGKEEKSYYILECEMPIFNSLPDEIFNMIEVIDCPGLNNQDRKKLREDMIKTLFSSLVCFFYITKVGSYETDSEYISFKTILEESQNLGVLKEE